MFIGFRGLSLLDINSKVLLETPSALKMIVFSTMLLIFGFVIFPGTLNPSFPSKTFSYPDWLIISFSVLNNSPKDP